MDSILEINMAIEKNEKLLGEFKSDAYTLGYIKGILKFALEE